MADNLNTAHLQKITNDLLDTLTSDEFLNRMREVRHAPQGERMKTAAMFLSIDALRNAGLDIPKDLRVTSRYFEETLQQGSAKPASSDSSSTTPGKATTLGFCAGGGAATVCGCAGNSVAIEI